MFTNSKSVFDEECYEVLQKMIDFFEIEQNHYKKSKYNFLRDDPNHPYDTLVKNGLGNETIRTGMNWSVFRPSDDPCKYVCIYNV